MSTPQSFAAVVQTMDYASWRIANAVIHAVARLLGLAMEVHTHELSDSDCERMGLPYGSTDPDVFVFAHKTTSWRRIDVWMEKDVDGSRCLNLDFLKHHGEIHFAPKRVNVGAANGR